MTDSSKAMAEFLAKGGTIKRAPFGASGLKCEDVREDGTPCKATGGGFGITRKRDGVMRCYDCVARRRIARQQAKAAAELEA